MTIIGVGCVLLRGFHGQMIIGRRFVCCPHSRNGGCRVFDWTDPPICARARMIIPGLLRNINTRVTENATLRKKNKMLFKNLILSWGVVAFLLMTHVWKFSRGGDDDIDGSLEVVKNMLP